MDKAHEILVTHDLSDCSTRALDYGIELAVKHKAKLHIVHVERMFGDNKLPDKINKTKAQSLRDELRESIYESMERLGFVDSDLSLITYSVLRDVAVAPAIIQYCEDYDIDLVVIGTHGRQGLKYKLLGSVAEVVVRFAPCTVLTVSEKVETAPLQTSVSSITVPIDFSNHSKTALKYARELANAYGATLNVIHVIEERKDPAFYIDDMRSIYDMEPHIEQKVLNALKNMINDEKGASCKVQYTVLSGHPVREIIQWAELRKTDLIVMATHGLSGLERAVLGSVAERVIRQAPCPVFTVKHKNNTKRLHSVLTDTHPMQNS